MNLHGSCVPSWSDSESESESFDVGCVATLLDSFHVFDVYSTILRAKMSSNIASQLKRKLQELLDNTNGTISTTSDTSTITGTSHAVAHGTSQTETSSFAARAADNFRYLLRLKLWLHYCPLCPFFCFLCRLLSCRDWVL